MNQESTQKSPELPTFPPQSFNPSETLYQPCYKIQFKLYCNEKIVYWTYLYCNEKIAIQVQTLKDTFIRFKLRLTDALGFEESEGSKIAIQVQTLKDTFIRFKLRLTDALGFEESEGSPCSGELMGDLIRLAVANRSNASSPATNLLMVVCPFCHQRGTTVTQKDLGFAAWLVAGGLCFLGCICCAPVALCVDSLKDTQHMCPNCKAIIGENKMIK
ncbi:LITAF-like zinc ribbon domain-containing protein [Globomyces pollinis-pini]|nr:LITAF-like zinc ribbon domain-containing protein [Globomyces pollinis-pini]